MFSSFLITIVLASFVSAQWPDPEPCSGTCGVHDPSIIKSTDGRYFLFGSGDTLKTSKSLNGPWTAQPGPLGNPALGAPDMHYIGGTYYMYYQYTVIGSNLYSNISVATSPDMSAGSWKDHGNLSIPESADYNLIDANLLIIPTTPHPTYYLSFGSFWKDIFQVPMSDPFTPSGTPMEIEYNQTYGVPLGNDPSEGSYQFMWPTAGTTYYYLFFSSGNCCAPGYKIPPGNEYKIMVCRADAPTGPFSDKSGRDCKTQNGGTEVLGSHGSVYAPGGQGVIYDESVDGGSVVLYYHYIKDSTDTGTPATFGWNKLDFGSDGWPQVTTLST